MTAGMENNNSVPLKVFYSNEIRRLSFSESAPTFSGLCALLGQAFGLEPASIVLKYQDNDGDKITMSTDGELKEAIKTTKEANLLRLFIDVKPAAPQQGKGKHVDLRGPFMALPGKVKIPRGHLRVVACPPPPPAPADVTTPPSQLPTEIAYSVANLPSSDAADIAPAGNSSTGTTLLVGDSVQSGKEGDDRKDAKEAVDEKSEKEAPDGKEGKEEAIHKVLKEKLCAMRQQIQTLKTSATTPEDKRAAQEKIVKMNAECNEIKAQMLAECQKVKEAREKAKEDREKAKQARLALLTERKVKQEELNKEKMAKKALQQERIAKQSAKKQAKSADDANVTPAAC